MARLLIASLFAILAVTAFGQSPISAPANAPLPPTALPPVVAATPPTAAVTPTAAPLASPPTPTADTPAVTPAVTPAAAVTPTAATDGPTADSGLSPYGAPSGSPSNGAVSVNRIAVAGGSFVAVALVSVFVF